MRFWNSRGFSLASVMIAAGLLTGLSLAEMQEMKNIGDDQSRANSPVERLGSSSSTLTVLTFNVWAVKKLGISISSQHENERLPIITKRIKELDNDIVALQEVWSFSLREKFIELLSSKYPHYFYRKFVGMGDGMIIFSKHPFIDEPVDHHVFDDGTALEEQHLLPFIGVQKGIYRVGIDYKGKEIDFFTFHIGAVYFVEDINDYNPKHVKARRKQIDEMHDFIQEYSSQERPTIIAGDLNTHFFDWDAQKSTRIRKLSYEYEKLVTGLNLSDAYMTANDIDLENDSMKDLDISTFDTKNNSYAGGEDGFFSNLPSEFIDYIFYKSHRDLSIDSSRLVFQEKITADEVEGTITVENRPQHLSDHWGLSATFNVIH